MSSDGAESRRPIWITFEEWIADPDKWKGKNYHIKSKPTIRVSDNGEVRMYDEYDHCYTLRAG
jgi:hypothetical protein